MLRGTYERAYANEQRALPSRVDLARRAGELGRIFLRMNPRWIWLFAFLTVPACAPTPAPALNEAEAGRPTNARPSVSVPVPEHAPADNSPDQQRANNLKLRFDQGTVGSEGLLKVAETNGKGKIATWAIVPDPDAPSAPHAFGTTQNTNQGSTFNLALAENVRIQNPDIHVSIKAVAGVEDQGGGPVWRARDADNYYVARWNPLEDNFRIYYVKQGERVQIASTTIHTNAQAWHRIRVTMVGTQIRAWFDGKLALEVEDATFSNAGMAGLWIKADGLTRFDDLLAAESTAGAK